MSSNRRWSPTLPTFGGRLAPRVNLPDHLVVSSYTERCASFFLERSSCSNLFIRRVDSSWLRRQGRADLIGSFISGIPGPVLFKYLMAGLPKGMSGHFQRKLSGLCLSGRIKTIEQWFYTVDGLVLPVLFCDEDPDQQFPLIDKLIKFGFENCANNYSTFITRMKSLKRLLRKDLAVGSKESRRLNDLSTYRKAAESYIYSTQSNYRQLQVCLCWTQTRATGLADRKMIYRSLVKAEETLATPRRLYSRGGLEFAKNFVPGTAVPGEPVVPPEHLSSVCWRVSSHVRGETAHLSAGPRACFEVPQHRGGQTGMIKYLASHKVLYRSFNFKDLSFEEHPPRSCSSSSDLLSWAIQEALAHPTYVRCVRLCAVPEPSKARTVTVGTLPYQIILGAMAKIFQPAIVTGISRTGLRSSRNLYEFLNEDLNPTNSLWAKVRDMEPKKSKISALSSDLEEATDYGDLSVARQILQGLIYHCATIDGFPVGLAVLAKTLFLGKRFCFVSNEQGSRFFVKRSGWLMGDRLTKVILTLSHEIGVRFSRIPLVRICGDDVIALSRDRESLERYQTVMEDLGFKISGDDHFISTRLMFYCEEGSMVPQKANDLPSICNRRGVPSSYVDYPRIRLILPVKVETQQPSYTDIGRFSLLGKETRWVHQNGDPASRDLFNRAGLLQHCMVPQPSDTLCPYIPHELAGDGGFPMDHQFLYKVILCKSRSPRETSFRLSELLNGKWGYRYVRSDILDNVIHKYHIMVPKVKILGELLPEESVVRANEKMLGSLRVPCLETPEKVFLRTWRAFYWHCILNNLGEPTLDLTTPRLASHCGSSKDLTSLELCEDFFCKWKNTGFTFQDKPDYLVNSKKIQVFDHLALPFRFSAREEVPDETRGLIQESHLDEFVAALRGDGPVPAVVQDRLHLWVEADSYISFTVSKWPIIPRFTVLVSNDKKLAVHIAEILVGKIRKGEVPNELTPMVIMVPPNDYMYGYFGHHVDPLGVEDVDYRVVVDFGQLNYLAFVEDPTFFDLDDIHVGYRDIYRAPRSESGLVRSSFLTGTPSDRLWSLTTQPLGHLLGPYQASRRGVIQALDSLEDPRNF